MNKGKNVVIPVLMPEEMKDEIVNTAKERNMSNAAYIRSLVKIARKTNINLPGINIMIIQMIERINGIDDDELKRILSKDIEGIIKLMK